MLSERQLHRIDTMIEALELVFEKLKRQPQVKQRYAAYMIDVFVEKVDKISQLTSRKRKMLSTELTQQYWSGQRRKKDVRAVFDRYCA
jgi:hypothetical protein